VTEHEISDAGDMEDVESFRQRARAWIRANLGPAVPEHIVGTYNVVQEHDELAFVEHDRAMQRRMFDAGFA
jgi:hypothetical protein